MIWYAGYGSNLSRDRFARYVAGCRDRTAPTRTTVVAFPGRLSFAGESTVWGGGMAFVDPEGDGEVHGRAYLLADDQLADVASQEVRYDGLATVAERDGLPVVVLTRSEPYEPAAPSAAYRRTILHGLLDGVLDRDAAVAYLLAAPGVDLVWDRDTIAALEHPDAVRG